MKTNITDSEDSNTSVKKSIPIQKKKESIGFSFQNSQNLASLSNTSNVLPNISKILIQRITAKSNSDKILRIENRLDQHFEDDNLNQRCDNSVDLVNDSETDEENVKTTIPEKSDKTERDILKHSSGYIALKLKNKTRRGGRRFQEWKKKYLESLLDLQDQGLLDD